MDITELHRDSHERVIRAKDDEVCIHIAIHSTLSGPALGGCRFAKYDSEDDALEDALRLSKGMTYKNILADLDFGGGKCTVMADELTPSVLRKIGNVVDYLGGMYITAEDVGTTVEHMKVIHETTNHVVGLSLEDNGSGDPSILTSIGVMRSMEAVAQHQYYSPSLRDLKISIQGLGKVGWPLMQKLHEEGAELYVSDINQKILEKAESEYGVTVLSGDDIYTESVDIFSPCAFGMVINDDTIDKLTCLAICGSANVQLQDNSFAQRLHDKGILYAPDYVVNAGGVINVSFEVGGKYNRSDALAKVYGIYNRMLDMFYLSAENNTTTLEVANQIVEGILLNREGTKNQS